MQDTKKVELKCIHVSSVFKFFGGIFFIIGLIVGLFGNILRIDIMSPEIIRVFPFMAKVGPGIFTGILFAVLYGLGAGMVACIFALLYNFFAALFGGVELGLKE